MRVNVCVQRLALASRVRLSVTETLLQSSQLGEVSFRLVLRKSLSPGGVAVRRACAEEATIFAGY